jgi:hypothetical protein
MPDRSRVMTQTNMDTLVLQFGGFDVGLTTPHSKKRIVTKVEQRKNWMDLTMMERVGDRWEKNGRILFDRPKPTVGCSASGRRRVDGTNTKLCVDRSNTKHCE